MLSVKWTAAQAFIVVSLLFNGEEDSVKSVQGFLQLSQMTFFINADETQLTICLQASGSGSRTRPETAAQI